MALYFTGNFQVFKEDLALSVALVYNTPSNKFTLQQCTIHDIQIIYFYRSLHIIIHAYIIYLSLGDIDTVYIPKDSMK